MAVMKMQISKYRPLLLAGSSLQSMGIGNYCLNIASIAQTLIVPINKRDRLKLRRFCNAKDTVNKIKRHHNEWVKIFPTPEQTKD